MATDEKWKARILDKIQRELDPPTQFALAMFYQQSRVVIRRLVGAGANAIVIRLIGIPAMRALYVQLLERLGIDYKDPSTDFLLKLIDDLVDEVRKKRRS